MSLFKRSHASVEQRIRLAILELRPLLHLDSAGVELVAFDAASGVVVLRLSGDCPDCELSASTLRQGIEAHLRRQVPEIREVIAEVQ